MTRFTIASLTAFAALGALSSLAAADETATPKPARRGVETLIEIKITGKHQGPIVAANISKAAQKAHLAELRQPFASRIEEAVSKDPF
jgi:hypothetical protein